MTDKLNTPTLDSQGEEAKRFCSFCDREIHEGIVHICAGDLTLSIGIDHDKEVPANERTGSADVALSMLCKQDKEQLDRIESKLNELLNCR